MKPEEKFNFSFMSDCTARRLTSSRTGRSRNCNSFPRPPAQNLPPEIQSRLIDHFDLENAWPLPPDAMEAALSKAYSRGIAVTGVEIDETGGCWTCPPTTLLSRILSPDCSAWVTQQPGCGGFITTVSFANAVGRWGAWLADRIPGEPECHEWRSLILETLVLGGLRSS